MKTKRIALNSVLCLCSLFAMGQEEQTEVVFETIREQTDSIENVAHQQVDTVKMFTSEVDTLLIENTDSVSTTPVKRKKGLFAKKDSTVIKKGFSFGPLPVVAYDQDKGFQYGALLNIYDYGDGSVYPHPRQQWYIEASAFTKGTQQYYLTYDTKHLIPHTRMSLAATCVYDKAMNFYGYNGYQSYYDVDSVSYWKKAKDKTGIRPEYMTAFYRLERLSVSFKADFIGNIWNNKLFWQGSYYFSYTRMRPINLTSINKGKDSVEMFSGQTLFEKYQDWGIIQQKEGEGGFTSALRAGLMWDTRDFEADPSRGIWAEANITIAPKFLGTTHPYYRYMAIFRHYLPIVRNQLTFAYRLNYQGTMGQYLPYYVIPTFSTIGREYDRDGVGGYRTARGIERDRVLGLDAFFFNTELRWKFVNFILWNQNVSLGLNAFFDGAMVTRGYNLKYRGNPTDAKMMQEYHHYIDTSRKEGLHMSAGGGFRIIINRNFIIAVDYAYPFKKQDGMGSLYINTGYLF
ncbi:MAG TPA: BamA/TamA family outer membrane protein [Paludibacteraceae bacterium]|nr:BamA/TamA family outer membrane protein [Paludibacteraceae bacterium]